DEVHVRSPAADLLLVLLGHAAEDADDRVRVLALVPGEAAEGGIDLLLGVGPDGAGVEQDDVRGGRLVDEGVPLAVEAADDQLAVEHVHLAADGVDVKGFGLILHGGFRGTGYEPGPEFG